MDMKNNNCNEHLVIQASQSASSPPPKNSQTPNQAPLNEAKGFLEVKPENFIVRYRECMKNHASALGGYAIDGCGEFMSIGEEGTVESLKCVVCGCHRNFHRKETDGDVTYHVEPWALPQSYYNCVTPPTGYPYVPPVSQMGGLIIKDFGGQARDGQYETVGPTTKVEGKKRVRTKFTLEQKERMLKFAKHINWKILKENEADVDDFCGEIGVSKQVLRVWLQNNKNTLSEKL